MRLSDILSPERIGYHIECSSKKRTLETVSQVSAKGTELSPTDIFEGLVARERLGSTGIGHGIALPHARLASATEAIGSLALLNSPIPFEAGDDQPVDLLFTLIVPLEATDEHLRLLAQLAEIFSQSEIRTSLRRATSKDVLYKLITEYGHAA